MCSMSFWKGMGAGLALGIGLGMAAAPKKKSRCHGAGNFLRMVGDMVDGVSRSMGL